MKIIFIYKRNTVKRPNAPLWGNLELHTDRKNFLTRPIKVNGVQNALLKQNGEALGIDQISSAIYKKYHNWRTPLITKIINNIEKINYRVTGKRYCAKIFKK